MQENQPQVPAPENDEVVVIDQFDTDGLKKNLETTLAQKRHFREKYEKEAAEKAELLKKIAEYEKKSSESLPVKEETPVEPKPASPDFDSLIDNFEVIRSLESDELSELRATAKELGVDPVKYVKSKAGQAHLKEFRSTKKTQESTPSPSNHVPVFNGKPIAKVFSEGTAEDKQKAYEAMMKRGRSGNSSI